MTRSANAVTPNGNDLNDVFRPVLRGQLASGARPRVLSRWGQQVFDREAPAPKWTADGKAFGVYFRGLTYADCNGQACQRKGVVTVMR